ncbi:fungal-specific transcription factor domain-containing protein [Dactylonectria macrodidyma]|uniref:Fungal-specific transcription factor domain-containing protein n=1 Tax=Dactylonectria macrodidyma TaxID=307937 RepID=A0A9P9EZA2_9HYPO|nr:fungal-specific transcription factor domain-containing protein [Dactylonectria macrodidyma]
MDSQQSPRSVIPRACHNCRIRKIRCNRQLPCSNCVTSHLICRPVAKSSAVVQLSPNERSPSEEQFQNLHERLCVVEEALKSQTSQSIKGSESRHVVNPQAIRDDRLTPNSSMGNRAPSFEGTSSFGQQTLLACQVSELTTSEAGHSPSILEEVAILRAILRNPENSPTMRPGRSLHELPNDDLKRMELPPSNFVIQVLGILKDTKSLLFLFHAVQDQSQVEELCRRIYFPLEPLSASELILFNGMFSVILSDLMNHTHENLDEEEVRRFQSVCQENFESAYETYEVVTSPTYQHTLALSIALIQAQMEGNLALHATLTSVAARHCLALGYHREERMMNLSSVEAQRARRLFWRIFIFDKNLSLRLGRAPIIQDYDVDVKQWIPSQDPGDSPWDQVFAAFVEFSRISAQIYQKLYSPSSNRLEASKRQALVDDLSATLSRWHEGWQQIDASKAYCREIFTTILEPAEVTYYSVLTILYRGMNLSNSVQDIVPACFEAAQQGLRAFLKLWPHNKSVPATHHYGIWIFLYSSFTPFIVAFLHCIKNEDAKDLELLKNVLDTVEQTSSVRETLKRQFDLCRALYRIAELFINDRLSTSDQRAALLNNTIALPLQPPFVDSWDFLDLNLPLSGYSATSTAFYI